jgi:hypothetical protein
MLLLAGADFAGAADVAGAGVELGAGVAAGAAIAFEPESAAAFLLLFEDLVLAVVSVLLAPAESAEEASGAAFLLLFDFDFVVVASGAAAAELSADIASLFFFLFEDFVPDAVSAVAAVEESALAAFLLFFDFDFVLPLSEDADWSALTSAFLDFFDFLVEVVVWSVVELLWVCAQPMVAQNIRIRQGNTQRGVRTILVFTGCLLSCHTRLSTPRRFLRNEGRDSTAFDPKQRAAVYDANPQSCGQVAKEKGSIEGALSVHKF